ncbi:MAG: GNAT family N-acetyltransferase, partial [Bacilli bacterium]|nr:GNAT family N-acetyltransferase [Bacilli bacterium]
TPIDEWKMLDIRQKVFMIEQNIPYAEDALLKEEMESKSFLICLNEEAIGTIRYRVVEEGIKIERFAILKEFRGKGYGKEAFMFLVDYIAGKYNPCRIFFHSQYYIKELYEKMGFITDGEPFVEAGIKHIKMYKDF